MVKFDEDFVLKAGATLAGAWGVALVGAPNEVGDKVFTTKVTRPALVHAGIGIGGCAASAAVAANSSDRKLKKDMLKVQGVCTLAASATNLWSGLKDKTQHRDLSIAAAVPTAAVGIASLVLAFRD